ncbi:MAG TPA: NYN domain-containing protein [Actinomycetes bacterium]
MGVEPLRVWVFIDAQNLYRDTRDAFHARDAPSSFGQVDPQGFGLLVAARGPVRSSRPRRLEEVRIYTGMPSSSKEPKTNAAHKRQRHAWEEQGVKVVARPLRYPKGWPSQRAVEKGVDVALAVDLVFNAARRRYDVGIVASTDTDLLPALEAVCELRRAWGTPRIEVTCWSPLAKRLRVDGHALWCHRLDRHDYESVRDPRNYARAEGS